MNLLNVFFVCLFVKNVNTRALLPIQRKEKKKKYFRLLSLFLTRLFCLSIYVSYLFTKYAPVVFFFCSFLFKFICCFKLIIIDLISFLLI